MSFADNSAFRDQQKFSKDLTSGPCPTGSPTITSCARAPRVAWAIVLSKTSDPDIVHPSKEQEFVANEDFFELWFDFILFVLVYCNVGLILIGLVLLNVDLIQFFKSYQRLFIRLLWFLWTFVQFFTLNVIRISLSIILIQVLTTIFDLIILIIFFWVLSIIWFQLSLFKFFWLK